MKSNGVTTELQIPLMSMPDLLRPATAENYEQWNGRRRVSWGATAEILEKKKKFKILSQQSHGGKM
jgi:hypothetical protein